MNQTYTGPDGKKRCHWCSFAPEFPAYHDTEWGFPVDDDIRLFEKLSLEGFQSGLSWRTILAKRENFRRAFRSFDFRRVAGTLSCESSVEARATADAVADVLEELAEIRRTLVPAGELAAATASLTRGYVRHFETGGQLARAAYFESLGRASEGNILAGIFYWLRSLAEVRGNEIVVRPIEPLRFSSLGEMPVEQLLTLSLIIQEGNLTADELARVFLIERPASQAILARLLSLNLLVRETREDGTEQFAVNRPIYIPLTRELRSRNILPRR